jgi:tetratricopeptide (TPR) repeat protein
MTTATRSSRPRPWRWHFGAVVALAALTTGCTATKQQRQAESAVQSYFAGDYARARADLRPLAQKTDENFVLNNARLGSAALVDYQLDEAEGAFYNAYEVINAGGVNDGGRGLGAVVVQENIKVWKGEPFERAMVNFYLGLVYYMRQDYANARAAFENALFKLRDYGGDKGEKGEQYQQKESNFALAYVMLGKSWQRLGREDLARANFDKAVKLQPDLAGLCDYERNLRSNLLLVVDYGYGPKKRTEFDGSVVGFGPKPWEDGPIAMPNVTIDGRRYDLQGANIPPIDLLAIAQDRKWQSIDTIRTIKSVVGEGLMAAGAVEGIRGAYGSGSAQRRDLIAAAALAGAGLLLKASSNPDLRQWETLPRTTFVIPLTVPPGTHEVRVDFPSGHNQTWRNLPVPAEGEATYYFRMQRWISGPFEWTGGGTPGLATASPAPTGTPAPTETRTQVQTRNSASTPAPTPAPSPSPSPAPASPVPSPVRSQQPPAGSQIISRPPAAGPVQTARP